MEFWSTEEPNHNPIYKPLKKGPGDLNEETRNGSSSAESWKPHGAGRWKPQNGAKRNEAGKISTANEKGEFRPLDAQETARNFGAWKRP